MGREFCGVGSACPGCRRQRRQPKGCGTNAFELEHYALQRFVVSRVAAGLIAAFRAARAGELDDDGFNLLLIASELGMRQVTVLRACCRYLLQTGIPFSQSYMERVLASPPPPPAPAGPRC